MHGESLDRTLRAWLTTPGLLLLWSLPAVCEPTILFLTSGTDPVYEQVIDNAISVLAGHLEPAPRVTVEPVDAEKNKTENQLHALEARLVVTIGESAAKRVSQTSIPTPTVYALLPKLSYEAITDACLACEPRQTSAIFLDQPLDRQLDLIRLALPDRVELGVLYGPTSWHQHGEVEHVAKAKKFDLQFEKVRENCQLNPYLEQLLERIDILLALPDPLVFNPESVPNLLMTTYRKSVPIVGFSRAYVEAGATLAVYSTPEQIGTQIGETVCAILTAGDEPLPLPQYPKYFNVSINHQAATSLNLVLPDEKTLTQQLKQLATQDD